LETVSFLAETLFPEEFAAAAIFPFCFKATGTGTRFAEGPQATAPGSEKQALRRGEKLSAAQP
jgi:hypothetical protein